MLAIGHSGPAAPIRAAFVWQLLLLVYLQAIEWIDLFPWNDVRRGNGQELLDIALGAVMIAALLATAWRWRPGMWLAALVYAIWLGLQITTFWVPYVTGASERWRKIHAANFAQTIQWLPSHGNHLPPDASHFVLQLLILVTLVATCLAAYQESRETRV
jgi:hypothetical protein